MPTADTYTNLVTARLFNFFDRHAPWHLALWRIGTALALDEAAEYSDLTREGAFKSNDGLRYVCRSVRALVEADTGARPPLQEAVQAALQDNAMTTDAGTTRLRYLADRVREGYLSRLASAIRSPDPPGIESIATLTAAHLLDIGFSRRFLHAWLRALLDRNPVLQAGDVLEEAATLCKVPPQDFEVMIPFAAVPLGYSGPMPEGWLDAHGTAAWLSQADPPPQGDLRQAGGVVVKTRARDAGSAVEAAAELVTQAAARVSVGSRAGQLVTKGVGWVLNDPKTYSLYSRPRIHLKSLRTSEDLFGPSANAADAVVYDALEIFAALEGGTRGAALTGGWAAVEGLLLRPSEAPHVLAADRLAAIIACSYPRAGLTALSHRHRPTASDELFRALEGVELNVERCRIVEQSIREGRPPIVARPSDLALLRRVESMVEAPAEKLENVRRYASETLRRLYTQRNLIMHAGSFQSVTLRATLRTAPMLVAAGIDRIVDARLRGRRVEPLALAARAEAELGLLGTSASRPLSNLLT